MQAQSAYSAPSLWREFINAAWTHDAKGLPDGMREDLQAAGCDISTLPASPSLVELAQWVLDDSGNYLLCQGSFLCQLRLAGAFCLIILEGRQHQSANGEGTLFHGGDTETVRWTLQALEDEFHVWLAAQISSQLVATTSPPQRMALVQAYASVDWAFLERSLTWANRNKAQAVVRALLASLVP